jgi:hypothetical protein
MALAYYSRKNIYVKITITTLNFLRNLQMGVSLSVCDLQAFPA